MTKYTLISVEPRGEKEKEFTRILKDKQYSNHGLAVSPFSGIEFMRKVGKRTSENPVCFIETDCRETLTRHLTSIFIAGRVLPSIQTRIYVASDIIPNTKKTNAVLSVLQDMCIETMRGSISIDVEGTRFVVNILYYESCSPMEISAFLFFLRDIPFLLNIKKLTDKFDTSKKIWGTNRTMILTWSNCVHFALFKRILASVEREKALLNSAGEIENLLSAGEDTTSQFFLLLFLYGFYSRGDVPINGYNGPVQFLRTQHFVSTFKTFLTFLREFPNFLSATEKAQAKTFLLKIYSTNINNSKNMDSVERCLALL